MGPPQEIGKRILSTLREKGIPLEIDFLAFATGSSITQVKQEAEKLASLDLINIDGSRLSLRQGNKFSNWERLKK